MKTARNELRLILFTGMFLGGAGTVQAGTEYAVNC